MAPSSPWLVPSSRSATSHEGAIRGPVESADAASRNGTPRERAGSRRPTCNMWGCKEVAGTMYWVIIYCAAVLIGLAYCLIHDHLGVYRSLHRSMKGGCKKQ